jgi:hypothetical protein
MTVLDRRTVAGIALAAAVAAIGLAGAVSAYADPVDLQIVNRDTGQPLPFWRHDGRLFVAGPPGARYSLRVTNNTEDRVLVVLSVDGVNIISGETADPGQTGYIFKPHESYDLSGWRKSPTVVAAFTFAPLPQSYAARTGRPGEVGVIGLAMFREEAEPPPPPPVIIPEPAPTDQVEPDAKPLVLHQHWHQRWRRVHGRLIPLPPPPPMLIPVPSPMVMPVDAPPPPPPPPPAPMALGGADASQVAEAVVVTAQKRSEKLGTAHGVLEESIMTTEPFERETSYPQFTRQIEYDSYDNLVAAGVIPRGVPDGQPQKHRPQAFPAQPDGAGFVPDPPPER